MDDKNLILASGTSNSSTADGSGLTIDLGSDGTATMTYTHATTSIDFNKDIVNSLKLQGSNATSIHTKEKNIIVMNTPDVNTISAAEHTIAMMLALSRNISQGDHELRQNKWNRHLLVGTELRNKTLGIVGLGKIGREVMSRSLPFGMNILGYDPFVNQKMFNEDEIRIVELDELLEQSDFITIHVPLNSATKSLFNTDL